MCYTEDSNNIVSCLESKIASAINVLLIRDVSVKPALDGAHIGVLDRHPEPLLLHKLGIHQVRRERASTVGDGHNVGSDTLPLCVVLSVLVEAINIGTTGCHNLELRIGGCWASVP